MSAAPGYHAVTDSGHGSFVGRDLYRRVMRRPLWSVFGTPNYNRLILTSATVLGKADWYAERTGAAWVCRLANESVVDPADLLVSAIAETARHWGPPPSQGVITFLPQKHRAIKTWTDAGAEQSPDETAEGLLTFQLRQGSTILALIAEMAR